jgi:hypothetical protein
VGIARFGNKGVEPVVSSLDFEGLFDLNPTEARQLEKLASNENWALGAAGTSSNLDFAVNEHVVFEVNEIDSVEDYLEAQARVWWPDDGFQMDSRYGVSHGAPPSTRAQARTPAAEGATEGPSEAGPATSSARRGPRIPLVSWLFRHDDIRVIDYIAATVVGGLIVGFLLWLAIGGRSSSGGVATVLPNIDQVRTELTKRGFEIVTLKPVQLHPPRASYLVVGQRTASDAASVNRSQALWLYDEDQGKLRQRLAFDPQIYGNPAKPPYGFRFEILAVRDFGPDGLTEVVGSYTFEAPQVTVRLPVLISWDDRKQRYRLEPLLRQQVPLAPIAAPAGERPYRGAYTVISEGHRVRSLAGETLAVMPQGHGGDLIEAYRLTDPLATRQRFEVTSQFFFRIGERLIVSQYCLLGPRGKRVDHAVLGPVLTAGAARYLVASAGHDADPIKVATTAWKAMRRADAKSRTRVARGSGFYIGGDARGGCNFGGA